MKKLLRFLVKTVKWVFIVFCLYLGSLFFREQTIPVEWMLSIFDAIMPDSLVVCVDSASFGFIHGLHLRGCRVYLRSNQESLDPVFSASSLSVMFVQRRVVAEGLSYLRLPDSYYEPGNLEKNSPVDIRLPSQIGRFELRLIRPNVLSVEPEFVVADVLVESDRLHFDRIHLVWPDRDEQMSIDGSCTLDLRQQRLCGEIEGFAKQRHIRPLIETLDIPVALPYFDGFTDVVGKVPATCSWDVNLINNDTEIKLKLNPTLGKYNTVSMREAQGDITLRVFTRGTSLNYNHTIGPVHALDPSGRSLDGTVTISGLNGTNTVHVTAKSAIPVTNILKIAGFTGEYVDEAVMGDASCDLDFVFPRAMTTDYEHLQGRGRVEIRDGQIMRMKGFKGLLALLADKVPGVSWFTDSTQASCSYVIKDGILTSDDIYIEGTIFSIKMFGSYDCCKDKLDYTVRVQFSKQETIVGKILHPLTWPFTKLLLEFRLTGSCEDPHWEYISVIDRVLEVAK